MNRRQRAIGIALGASIAALAATIGGQQYVNRYIPEVIAKHEIAPEWVTYVPGASNKVLDMHLEQMKRHYENAPSYRDTVGFDRGIWFAKHHVSDRLPEVYSTIIQYLEQSQDSKEADFYRKEAEYVLGKKFMK